MLNIMRDVGGIELPEVLGKILQEKKPTEDNGEASATTPAETTPANS